VKKEIKKKAKRGRKKGYTETERMKENET